VFWMAAVRIGNAASLRQVRSKVSQHLEIMILKRLDMRIRRLRQNSVYDSPELKLMVSERFPAGEQLAEVYVCEEQVSLTAVRRLFLLLFLGKNEKSLLTTFSMNLHAS